MHTRARAHTQTHTHYYYYYYYYYYPRDNLTLNEPHSNNLLVFQARWGRELTQPCDVANMYFRHSAVLTVMGENTCDTGLFLCDERAVCNYCCMETTDSSPRPERGTQVVVFTIIVLVPSGFSNKCFN